MEDRELEIIINSYKEKIENETPNNLKKNIPYTKRFINLLSRLSPRMGQSFKENLINDKTIINHEILREELSKREDIYVVSKKKNMKKV